MRIGNIHIGTAQQPERQTAQLASLPERLPERPGSSGNQERSSGRRWPGGAPNAVLQRVGIHQTSGAVPPPWHVQYRVRSLLPRRELSYHTGQRRGPGLGCADIKRSGLIVPLRTGHEAVPVKGAQQSPDRYGL
jgi:hypothetical protein